MKKKLLNSLFLTGLLGFIWVAQSFALPVTDPSNGNTAAVNDERQLSISAVVQSELEHESEENGAGYIWTSQDLDIDIADTLLFLRNTSDINLHIDQIIVTGGNVAVRYEIHIVTDTTALTGATVTGFNLNTTSSNVADAAAVSDETAISSQGTVIYDLGAGIRETVTIDTAGLVLGKNISLAADQAIESTGGNVSFIGHYAD